MPEELSGGGHLYLECPQGSPHKPSDTIISLAALDAHWLYGSIHTSELSRWPSVRWAGCGGKSSFWEVASHYTEEITPHFEGYVLSRSTAL